MTVVVDVPRLLERLRATYDVRALLNNVDGFANVLRRLGYPLPPEPGFLVGNRTCFHAWKDPALHELLRIVSVRLFAWTAPPAPTPEQLRLRIRALEGALADITRVQQIWSPDRRSHHQGRPADEDYLTFWCWLWRRSRQYYQHKETVSPGAWAHFWDAIAVTVAKLRAATRRRASTKRRPARPRTRQHRR